MITNTELEHDIRQAQTWIDALDGMPEHQADYLEEIVLKSELLRWRELGIDVWNSLRPEDDVGRDVRERLYKMLIDNGTIESQ